MGTKLLTHLFMRPVFRSLKASISSKDAWMPDCLFSIKMFAFTIQVNPGAAEAISLDANLNQLNLPNHGSTKACSDIGQHYQLSSLDTCKLFTNNEAKSFILSSRRWQSSSERFAEPSVKVKYIF